MTMRQILAFHVFLLAFGASAQVDELHYHKLGTRYHYGTPAQFREAAAAYADSIMPDSSIWYDYVNNIYWRAVGPQPPSGFEMWNPQLGDPIMVGGSVQAQARVDREFARARANHTGTQAISTVTNLQATLDGKEVSGAAATAQANAVQRANHTGTQAISTITGLQSALDAKLSAEVDGSVTNELELPSQTGNAGKVLGTNGTNQSWVDPTGAAWSFNNAPGRTIQTVAAAGNGWQVSSTHPADVRYSVTIGTTVSLSGNSTGYVVMEIAATNSSTAGNWTEIARVASGQSGTLVIGLTLNQTGGGCLSGSVPAGYYVRVRSVNTAGTPSYTMNSGQEVTK